MELLQLLIPSEKEIYFFHCGRSKMNRIRR